jgi:type I restriction enzyme, S subunit
MIGEKRTTNLRWLCQNLDYLRVPLNATERSSRSGPFPYWGANGIVDHLNEYLVDEPVVLIGEDGAPFFEPHKPVAFYVNDKIWPNNHIHILRPGSKIEGRFLTYYLNTVDYSKYINGSTRDKLTQTQLGNIKITYPELPVQKSIVRWLDVETARIEGLIAKKTKLIDLLNEKLLAVVTHAVTSGLTPSVPMQPTGLSWLSQAPAHWNVYRLATLLRQVNEAGDATLPVLSVSIHTGISDRQLDDEERDRKVIQIEDKTSYKRVRPNDLAYNMMRAWQGAFGIATVDGLVSPAYVVSRPSKMVYPPYLEYLLRTPLCVEEMRRASKGIASFRLRMYWEAFRQIRIALPPFEEQQEIARYLARARHRSRIH